MMSNVLTVEQREQAGSDSYNRFEYQVKTKEMPNIEGRCGMVHQNRRHCSEK